MPGISSADQSVSPPIISIPREYNAAYDLIERNLLAGRANKIAYIDDHGTYTYGELAARINRFANALIDLGIHPEQRILLCLQDSIDFPTAFLGAIKAGIVPVAVNTLLTAKDYEYMLRDSRARAVILCEPLLQTILPLVDCCPCLKHVFVSGSGSSGYPTVTEILAQASPVFEPADTCSDDICFWLYSSGSTGVPKGTAHCHSSLIQTAELYAKPILGIQESDVVFSAAKLFFAYGLGNGLTFPLAVGATAILMAERPTPAAVFARLRQHQPTIFYGVPTLFASMLAHPDLPAKSEVSLRICTSAGEALPEKIGMRWHEHFGVDILDGIGSTEMLHIFLSNRSGQVRYGTTGRPVPGYELRVVDDDSRPVGAGEAGELQISGPTSAAFYWNNRERTRKTFQGYWTRSGDKYSITADGYYIYEGRRDDMLKVSGIYVSPSEVESALITHEAVLEAAVVAKEDKDRLIKPAAFIVLKPGHIPSPALEDALKKHVKSLLAPYKYPRWFIFVETLPKTATGKIQRFRLRELAAIENVGQQEGQQNGSASMALLQCMPAPHNPNPSVLKA